MKKQHSLFDNRGALRVDCTECTRGSKGTDVDKCSAGWRNKRPGMGCFIGTLKPEIDRTKLRMLS
jgi:hypothetical protein